MRTVSKKRARELNAYRTLRVSFLEANPLCELECGAAASEVHHKRGRVGVLLLSVEHWAALCSPCHRHITEHPAEAYALGISERRVGA